MYLYVLKGFTKIKFSGIFLNEILKEVRFVTVVFSFILTLAEFVRLLKNLTAVRQVTIKSSQRKRMTYLLMTRQKGLMQLDVGNLAVGGRNISR